MKKPRRHIPAGLSFIWPVQSVVTTGFTPEYTPDTNLLFRQTDPKDPLVPELVVTGLAALCQPSQQGSQIIRLSA